MAGVLEVLLVLAFVAYVLPRILAEPKAYQSTNDWGEQPRF
ncbi:MAG: hypothetical protein V1787_05645 [Candidatus Micrarchaeota archaeon]